MHALRLITIQFNTEIKSYEIPAFRGAMVKKVGREHDWFHNHNHKNDGFHHRYPRIQYKRHQGKPMLVCIENGIEEIQKYFSQANWDLTFSDKTHKMGIETLRVHEFNIRVMDELQTYRIQNWIGLNSKNHKAYQDASAVEQLQILEKALSGHMISFLKNINYRPEKRFKVALEDFPETRTFRWKGLKHTGFNLTFKTDLFLPNYIGLGKAASVGFGTVRTAPRSK